MALETTWTQQEAVEFNVGMLSDINACRSEVEALLHRGTLSASSTPTSTQVDNWLKRGKQEVSEKYGFSWRRVFVYASTVAGTYRYALPKDFTGSATILRDLNQDTRLGFVDPITFDTMFPDVAGEGNATPEYYTVKDRELWFSAPVDGVYTLELEYDRTGAESGGAANDFSYVPEIIRYRVCDYATYKAYLMLQQWDAANIYKAEWLGGVEQSKHGDAGKKWAAMNYMARNWHNIK